MPFQVLSWYPRIVLFPKFLDHDKCDHVVEIGKKKLHGSSLSLRKGETVEGTRDIRTRFYPPTHPHRPLFCAFTLKCRSHAQPMPGQRLCSASSLGSSFLWAKAGEGRPQALCALCLRA